MSELSPFNTPELFRPYCLQADQPLVCRLFTVVHSGKLITHDNPLNDQPWWFSYVVIPKTEGEA